MMHAERDAEGGEEQSSGVIECIIFSCGAAGVEVRNHLTLKNWRHRTQKHSLNKDYHHHPHVIPHECAHQGTHQAESLLWTLQILFAATVNLVLETFQFFYLFVPFSEINTNRINFFSLCFQFLFYYLFFC